jgi:hypothetical protein
MVELPLTTGPKCEVKTILTVPNPGDYRRRAAVAESILFTGH